MKEAEKALLSEKVSALQAELSTAALEQERLSRETALLRDQERVRIQRCFTTLAVFPSKVVHKFGISWMETQIMCC